MVRVAIAEYLQFLPCLQKLGSESNGASCGCVPRGQRPRAGGRPQRGVLPGLTTACRRRLPASAALPLPAAPEAQR